MLFSRRVRFGSGVLRGGACFVRDCRVLLDLSSLLPTLPLPWRVVPAAPLFTLPSPTPQAAYTFWTSAPPTALKWTASPSPPPSQPGPSPPVPYSPSAHLHDDTRLPDCAPLSPAVLPAALPAAPPDTAGGLRRTRVWRSCSRWRGRRRIPRGWAMRLASGASRWTRASWQRRKENGCACAPAAVFPVSVSPAHTLF